MSITNCLSSVDGNFTSWSAWSDCTETCIGGEQYRVRNCTDPEPAYGGLNCSGVTLQWQNCSEKTQCSGEFSPSKGDFLNAGGSRHNSPFFAAHMFRIVRVGLSTHTTGENCEKGTSKSLALRLEGINCFRKKCVLCFGYVICHVK